METYSKALNAGQYPLSVLAMTGKAANCTVRNMQQYYDQQSKSIGCCISSNQVH